MFAGAISLEDALRLVKVRAQAMQAAAETTEGAMISVVGLEESVLQSICEKASQETGEVCQIANYLFQKGYVVSGTQVAM